MLFKSVIAAAALLASSVVEAKLGFTSFPQDVKAGEPVSLSWSGADGPVTLTLKKGPSKDLKSVKVLTSSASGGKYSWTPSKDLGNGSDYALEISSGNDINYTGEFSVSGGSKASSSSSSSSTSSASSTRSSKSHPTSVTAPIKTTGVSKTSAPKATGTASSAVPKSSNGSTTVVRPTLKASSLSIAAAPTATATSTGPQSTTIQNFGAIKTASPMLAAVGAVAVLAL